MATQLSIFNDALGLLGIRSLVATTDSIESARVLNGLWDHVRKFSLEQAPWKFAEKYALVAAIAPPVTSYGLAKAFAKPSDFVRLNAVATEITFDNPTNKWLETGSHWYSDTTTDVHIQYVSNDASYGYNVALWPESFTNFVTHYLAIRAAPRLAPQLVQEAATQQNQEGNSGGYLAKGLEQALQAAIEFNDVGGPPQYYTSGEPTKLSIFNDVMNILGGRTLTRITDTAEPATVLNGLWDHVRMYCLEQGRWKFAEREVLLTPSLTELPTFGFRSAFEKPADFVRVNEISSDEYFSTPIFQIHERGDFWYCDLDELYIRYISNDNAWGFDLTKWPESFVTFVTLYLAVRAAPRLAPRLKPELIRIGGNVDLDGAKKNALAKDAVAGPTQFIPEGRWSGVRQRRPSGRNSRRSLYGT